MRAFVISLSIFLLLLISISSVFALSIDQASAGNGEKYTQDQKESDHNFDLHLEGEEALQFEKIVFLGGIRDGRIHIDLDASQIPSSYKNAKINVKLSDGTIIGIVLKNGQISVLQLAAVQDPTLSVFVSDSALLSMMSGKFDLSTAIKEKQVVVLNKDGSAFNLKSISALSKYFKTDVTKQSTNLVGNVLRVSETGEDSGVLGVVVIVALLTLAVISFYLTKNKGKRKKLLKKLSSFKKRLALFGLLLIMSLYLIACGCDLPFVKGGDDVTYELSADDYAIVEEAIAEARLWRDAVEARAMVADQDKVFDNRGNTGYETFITEIDAAINDVEDALANGQVYGAYTEDYDVEDWGAYYSSSGDYYVVNLDYLSDLPPVDFVVHEGLHAVDGGHQHSNDLEVIMEEAGGPIATEEFVEQIVADQDTPYMGSLFYTDLTPPDSLYEFYVYDCGLDINLYSEAVADGLITAEEAKSTMDDYFLGTGCDAWVVEWATNFYDSYEQFWDEVGITEEEYEQAYSTSSFFCNIATPSCEEMIDEAFPESP